MVLGKQAATIKGALTAARSWALLAVARAEVADLDSLRLAASMEVFLEQHTNESADCLVPELVHLLVVARAVVDLVVVPESQVLNLASVNLATGHEVLHEVVSMEAAHFVEADLDVAYPHRRPQSADQLELVAEELVVEHLLEQVCKVLEEVSVPGLVAVQVAGHRALLWLSLAW